LSGRRLLWVLVRSVARILFLLAFRARVFGQHNVPRSGGALIVSNHESYLDPVLLGFALERPVSYMARQSLFRNRAFGWLISSLNAFPLSPGAVNTEAIREAVRRLQRGGCLLVFPEGTRTRDGRIGPLRPGVLAIVDRARVPIVPAVIEGTFEAWPRGRWPRPGSISVAYGRPIPVEDYGRWSRAELVQKLQAELSRLQGELWERKARSRGGSDCRE